jgi:hypothetical protein
MTRCWFAGPVLMRVSTAFPGASANSRQVGPELVAVRHLSPQHESILPKFMESSLGDSFGNRCGDRGRRV